MLRKASCFGPCKGPEEYAFFRSCVFSEEGVKVVSFKVDGRSDWLGSPWLPLFSGKFLFEVKMAVPGIAGISVGAFPITAAPPAFPLSGSLIDRDDMMTRPLSKLL